MSAFIETALKNEGLGFKDSSEIAKCIMKLSDYYITNPNAETPWGEQWARVAYAAYFLPFNYLRALRVFEKCQERNFFLGLDHLVDFGAGLATATAAIQDFMPAASRRILIEKSNQPAKMISGNWPELEVSKSPLRWEKHYTDGMVNFPEKSLCVFSYSLTELTEIPEWALKSEALLIMEPATQQDSRRLLGWRDQLIKKSNYVYAPCTHQEACPLLVESKTDWCHDRVHVEMPAWYAKIEELLPIKNRTLTVSYLAVRKTPPKDLEPTIVRLTGDLLEENGKDRQLICRGPKREFISWMLRHGKHKEHKRGNFYELDDSFEVRANELRVPKDKFEN